MFDFKKYDLDFKDGVFPDIIVLGLFILSLKLMVEATDIVKTHIKKDKE